MWRITRNPSFLLDFFPLSKSMRNSTQNEKDEPIRGNIYWWVAAVVCGITLIFWATTAHRTDEQSQQRHSPAKSPTETDRPQTTVWSSMNYEHPSATLPPATVPLPSTVPLATLSRDEFCEILRQHGQLAADGTLLRAVGRQATAEQPYGADSCKFDPATSLSPFGRQ